MISRWTDQVHIEVTGTRCHCEVNNQCTVALHVAVVIMWFMSVMCCYAAIFLRRLMGVHYQLNLFFDISVSVSIITFHKSDNREI